MSDDVVKQLSAEISGLSVEEIIEPDMPVATAIAEAQASVDLVDHDAGVRERLFKSRYKAAEHAKFKQLLAALIVTQQRWNRVRVGRDDQAYIDEVERAEVTRRNILKAADYSCGDDRVAAGRLSGIREGEGVADLLQDLRDLDLFLVDYEPMFAQDETFDVATARADLAERLERLSPLTSVKLVDGERPPTKEERDRVYTLFTLKLRDLRRAAAGKKQEQALMGRILTAMLATPKVTGRAGKWADHE